MTLVLEGMSPAQEQGVLVLLELFQGRRDDWTLVGGQMMYLLALENGAALPRTNTDMDVVINVVESPGAMRALAVIPASSHDLSRQRSSPRFSRVGRCLVEGIDGKFLSQLGGKEPSQFTNVASELGFHLGLRYI